MLDFNTLRQKYTDFIYHSFDIEVDKTELHIQYDFEIVGLSHFRPTWTFPLKNGISFSRELLENLVFSLGMVELISYWKCTCSPNVTVLPFALDEDMILWWKNLYFGGLGEFFYKNGIKTDLQAFMQIKSGNKLLSPANESCELSGNLVAVGGGKDSAVTINLLKVYGEEVTPYVINSRGATEQTISVAGLENKAYKVRRTLDKALLELNAQGFLNGHTPFSALVAFSSILSALIEGKKYVVLSNESSANETTVLGEEINHQFSKGEEFERHFIEYEKKYINSGVEYFSLLRPLSEMQIAALFARFKEYHPVFKSCNVGSKTDVWCCSCPKCLFVYTILSPFLSLSELENVFGENLLDKAYLLDYYKELTGILPNKPFECVGSRDEVITASLFTLKKIKAEGGNVPFLLRYLESNIKPSSRTLQDYMDYFDGANHLPDKFLGIIKSAIREYLRNV